MNEIIKKLSIITLSLFTGWGLGFFIAISLILYWRKIAGTISTTFGIIGLIFLILMWFFPYLIENVNGIIKKCFIIIYGSELIAISAWFWFTYGLFGIIPPVTSIALVAGVVSMWILIKYDKIRENVFGEEDTRKFLLKMGGTIFTGFVLMITILWGLMSSSIELFPGIVYIQSFLLVLLFFYFVSSFYCILADLNQT